MSRLTLVSLSGGMDSATALALAVQAKGKAHVQAVGFGYGSKHNPYEIACAEKLADFFGVEYDVISVSSVFYNFESALMDREVAVPEGHYDDENMRLTVVPNRNLIFLSILAGLAVSRKASEIWLGVHAGDHRIYPDCRPEFIESARQTIKLATDSDLNIVAPFLYMKKKDILRVGYDFHVPYHLTRTCYKEQQKSCGKCGSCQERLESFQSIGVEDPLEYESRELLPKKS